MFLNGFGVFVGTDAWLCLLCNVVSSFNFVFEIMKNYRILKFNSFML